MNSILLEKLRHITPEEHAILDGHSSIDKTLYSDRKHFIVDSKKMLEKGKLISMRPHTRFVPFPEHRHNYIEIVYMCNGSSTHIINRKYSVVLEAGELLFLGRQTSHEILPTTQNDIAVNFIILPEFFDKVFLMMKDESILHDFLTDSLKDSAGSIDYLHFKVKNVLPIQNLVENMISSLVNKETGVRNIHQTTMGLLFLHLEREIEKIDWNGPGLKEQNFIFSVLRYIQDDYKTASLTELSRQTGKPIYTLSKIIKKNTGQTFKSLLRTRRLQQAAFLLANTRLSVEDIIALIGYDNTGYFFRLFKNCYRVTPKEYRCLQTAALNSVDTDI